MEPTFYDNEYLIINEISYRFSDPDRGDVVVIKSKNNPKEYLIKRIVGLPGEKVEIGQGEVTIYNNENPSGTVLEEEYLPKNTKTAGNVNSPHQAPKMNIPARGGRLSYCRPHAGPLIITTSANSSANVPAK